LFALARALGAALTSAQVAAAAFEHIMRSVGASTVGIWLLDEDGVIRFAGGAGHSKENDPDAVGDIPLDSEVPAAVAVRTGELISFGSTQERDLRWPALTGLSSDTQAMAVVPLIARGHGIGSLHVGWPAPQDDFEPDVDLLWAVSALCATALDRDQLCESERRARETLEFLSRGTRIMVSALDPLEIVRSLVGLAVPRLAPWCAVYVPEDGELVRLAIEISLDHDLAVDLRNAVPVALDADVPLAEVFRTGRPAVLSDVPAGVVMRTYPEPQARKVLSLGGPRWSALVLPIEAGGEVIGVMSLVSPAWGARPPAEVVYAAEGLAARAGVALRNAERYRVQVENVQLLTAALLPEGVPHLRGWRFAARYAPASGGVCGDWYEAELMPDGLVLLGVGDASGHGLVAAATMARVRHAARGLAVAGIRPGQMLDHLSRLLTAGADSIATSIYGLVDPGTGTGRWASAGHPPPIMIHPDKSVICVGLDPGPPVGLEGAGHAEVTLDLPVGGRLVLYTDGLFERRGEDPVVGIQRLVELIGRLADGSEEEIADGVMATRSESDDACVLVIGR
jgi:GAF domain-containing protein